MISCTLAAALATLSPRTIAATLFPPVSERDQPGIDELETQTTNLLSFRPIEQTIFDTQVAFNLLSKYGDESKPSLESTRAAIARDVAQYLAGRAPVPAIQLIQTPVFLRLRILRLRGICRTARARATGRRVPESGSEDRRGRKIPRRRTSASQVKAKFSWRRFRRTRTSLPACGFGELQII